MRGNRKGIFIEPIDEEFVRLLQDMASISGVDKGSAGLFAIIYLEPEPLSLEELSGISGLSLPSVSSKTNTLERAGMINKERMPHSRKVFVSSNKDFGEILRELLVERQRKKLRMAHERLPSIIERYRKNVHTDKGRKKLKIMENYCSTVICVEKAVDYMMEALGRDLAENGKTSINQGKIREER